MAELKYALRRLTRTPFFTLSVIALLTVGIGSSTIVFTLFDLVLLRPLPVLNPRALVRIAQPVPKIGLVSSFPYQYYDALHLNKGGGFSYIFGETGKYLRFSITEPRPAEVVTVHGVTPTFFQALGISAQYGRALIASDDRELSDGAIPAVLSYDFWQQRFGGNVSIVGKMHLVINNRLLVVVGVMPRTFNGLDVDMSPDIRVPLHHFIPLADLKLEQVKLELTGRLKPGVTLSQAQAECLSTWQTTMKDYLQYMKLPPKTAMVLLKRGVTLSSLEHGTSILRDHYAPALTLVMGSALILLILVCSNIAGLLMARSAAHRGEIAIRLALGASPLRLMKLGLAESLWLGVGGTLGGVLFASLLMPTLAGLLPPIRDLHGTLSTLSLDLEINLRVLSFAVFLAIATTALFGIGPLLLAIRTDFATAFRASHSSIKIRGRHLMVVSQVALCTFLLVLASLFVLSFRKLSNVDPGFDQQHVLTFTLDIGDYSDPTRFIKSLIDHTRQIPGVQSVAVASSGVMRGRGIGATVAPAGQQIIPSDFLNCSLNFVTGGYFETMGLRLLTGRDFMQVDDMNSRKMPTSAVVNQTFVRKFFPNVNPLGKEFGTGLRGASPPTYRIIGVVSDAKYRSLREPIPPTFYVSRSDLTSFILIARTYLNPQSVIQPVRRTVATIDTRALIVEIHTLSDEVRESTAGDRLTAEIASIFGVAGLVIAGVGVFGLLAYMVVLRRREVGIRIAIGSTTRGIVLLFITNALKIALAGICLGGFAGIISGFALRALLFEISPWDPTAIGAASLLMIIVAAGASIIPVLRATHTDPSETLRLEN